jgi:hypothetical protein
MLCAAQPFSLDNFSTISNTENAGNERPDHNGIAGYFDQKNNLTKSS